MNSMIAYVFRTALGLSHIGQLKNELYCKADKIYLLNFNNTVLFQFVLPEENFEREVSFNSEDFSDDDFREVKGQAIFSAEYDDFIYKRICGKAKKSFSYVDKLFKKYFKKSKIVLNLGSENVVRLDRGLSHVEIFSKDSMWSILQRNIYSGDKIIVEGKQGGFFKVPDFGPVGLQTDDFLSVFSFGEKPVKFYFEVDNKYCMLTTELNLGPSQKIDMSGIIAGCQYDEMGTIEVAEA